MTRARDDRRRNNRAAFVESFTRPDEFTDRAAAAICGLLAYDAEARGHYVKEVRAMSGDWWWQIQPGVWEWK